MAMAAIRDRSVVLRRHDYSETSQIVVLFTREHGKVRVIAKGIRRSTKTRFAVGIDLLEVGVAVFSSAREKSSGLASLTEWKQTLGLGGLRERIGRIHAGEYAVDVTAGLTEDWDPHEPVFDALVELLTRLVDATDVIAPLYFFQRALLVGIGLMPELHCCVKCGKATSLTHFSSFEGGMFCKTCAPGQREKRAVTPITRRLLADDRGPGEACGGDDSGQQADYLGPFRALNYHLAHLMRREPALARWILRVKRN